MIRQGFLFIADKIRASKLFETVIDIAELYDTAQGSYPVQYIGQGNYKPINISENNGLAYLRKLSPMRFGKSPIESREVCDSQYEQAIIPIRILISIRKEKLGIDNAFASDYLAEEFFRILQGRSGELANSSEAIDAEILINEINDDRLHILSEEFAGAGRDIPYDYLLMTIDLDLVLQFNRACMAKFCEGYDYE